MSIYFRLSDLSLEELIWSSEEHVEEMINEGMTREKILLHLASVAERLSGPESTVSILYLDEDGLLRNGSSPKLPEDYIAAIDRLRIAGRSP